MSKKIEEQLAKVTEKVYEIDETIESIREYSYQYNIKILRIPEANDN